MLKFRSISRCYLTVNDEYRTSEYSKSSVSRLPSLALDICGAETPRSTDSTRMGSFMVIGNCSGTVTNANTYDEALWSDTVCEALYPLPRNFVTVRARKVVSKFRPICLYDLIVRSMSAIKGFARQRATLT